MDDPRLVHRLIKIHDTRPRLQLFTEDDRFLMQIFIDKGYDHHHMHILNECRMYLQVISLSDMCTADGKYLTYDAYHGNISTRPRLAGWPRRPPQLPASHWTLWKQALGQCILASTTDRKLLHPVGNWLPVATTHWKWYFSPQEQRLYHRTPDGFEVFSRAPAPTRPTSSCFHPINHLEATLPADALLATVAKLTADR